MTREFTAPEIVTTLRKWGGIDDSPEAVAWLDAVLNQMNGWLRRGDGIAVYENQDLGHPELGDKRFTSYGSSAAQLETFTPPTILPDGVGGTVNWRYTLVGVYGGPDLLKTTEG